MRRCPRDGSNSLDHDAHRDAGVAAFAGRAIGDHLAAAETGMGERLVQRLGQRAVEAGEDLAFDPAGQIGAGPAGGEEKLRQGVTFFGRSRGTTRSCVASASMTSGNAPQRQCIATTIVSLELMPGGDGRRFPHQHDGQPAVGRGVGIFRQQRLGTGLARDFIDAVAVDACSR